MPTVMAGVYGYIYRGDGGGWGACGSGAGAWGGDATRHNDGGRGEAWGGGAWAWGGDATGRKGGTGSTAGVGQGTPTAIDAERRSVDTVELTDHAGALPARRLAGCWCLIFRVCAGCLIFAEAREQVPHLRWALVCMVQCCALLELGVQPKWTGRCCAKW